MQIELGWVGGRANVAKTHEFGSSRHPRRSHIIRFVEEHREEALRETLDDSAEYLFTKPKLFATRLAQRLLTSYRAFIMRSAVTPALKAATVRAKQRKGSLYPATPLVDTGRMVSSIIYRISA